MCVFIVGGIVFSSCVLIFGIIMFLLFIVGSPFLLGFLLCVLFVSLLYFSDYSYMCFFDLVLLVFVPYVFICVAFFFVGVIMLFH